MHQQFLTNIMEQTNKIMELHTKWY